MSIGQSSRVGIAIKDIEIDASKVFTEDSRHTEVIYAYELKLKKILEAHEKTLLELASSMVQRLEEIGE